MFYNSKKVFKVLLENGSMETLFEIEQITDEDKIQKYEGVLHVSNRG